MPAYNVNGFYAIFFVAFMLINYYVFINVILATIYTNYRKHLKVSSIDCKSLSPVSAAQLTLLVLTNN